MDKRISGLPSATSVNPVDQIVLNQGGVTKKVDIQTFMTGAPVPTSVLQVATYAALPTTPTGLYLVLADETKGGGPSMYFFTTSARFWLAMVQDS